MIIALLGAECSGKSTLATALHRHLQAALSTLPANRPAPQVTHVTEYLREWCQQHGRTPQPGEQAHIADVQYQKLLDATRPHASSHWVIADTTPLMTAVYSDQYFGDLSLYALARQCHATGHIAKKPLVSDGVACTWPTLNLLMGLDLPWQPDGALRDGPAVQQATDDLLRQQLNTWQLPFRTVYGNGHTRVAAGLQAIAGHLMWHAPTDEWALAIRHAIEKEADNVISASGKQQKYRKYAFTCECCDDTNAERQMFSRLVAKRPAAPGSVRP